MPVLRHGGGGARTEIVCGYLHSDDPLFDPAIRALPPVFVVRLPDGAAAGWVRASIDYALAEAAPPSNKSSSPIATKLPELVLDRSPACASRHRSGDRPRMARRATRSGPGPGTGAPAPAPPERRWTVAALAVRSAVSRSVLDDRFRQLLGRSPIRYLARGGCTWRRSCSRRPTPRSSAWLDASATTPRRHSVERSSASTGWRRAAGERPAPPASSNSTRPLEGRALPAAPVYVRG